MNDLTKTTTIISLGCKEFINNSKKVHRDYAEACEWISEFGVDYKKTRFGSYERDIEAFINAEKDVDGGGEPEDLIRKYLNAHLEAIELIRIKEAFNGSDMDQLTENIKKIRSGQRFRNAIKEDQSRNFAFELGIASRFVKAGYEVDLGSESDVVVNIEGRKLYVECKRLKSYPQLKKRIIKASDQLKKRIEKDKSSKSRGLIAINITDIINSEARQILCNTVNVYRKKSEKIMYDFVSSEKEKNLSFKNNYTKCLGVLTEFSTQGVLYNKDNVSLVNIREANLLEYRTKQKQQDRDLIDSFWFKLGNQDFI